MMLPVLMDYLLFGEAVHVWQGIVKRRSESLDESFVLVYMTGMRQTKSQYMDYIANGTLNYNSEKTEHMEIAVNGELLSSWDKAG